MRTGRPIPPLTLTADERETLERWTRRPTTARALAGRARVVLECAAGKPNTVVARELRLTKQTVGKWRSRFLRQRLDGLLDEPRPGAPRRITDDDVERVMRLTLETAPRDATHWSTRAMARRCGLSQTAVSRIWRAFSLRPHRVKTFKLSKDPLFIEKVRDIVGLYLHPPDKALVLCVDEKAQIQALDRTQPVLPMRPEQVERRTHDYTRHGTTSLFAALNVATGKVIGEFHQRHRAVEFRKFLNTVEAAVPATLDVHLILDNYAYGVWTAYRERSFSQFLEPWDTPPVVLDGSRCVTLVEGETEDAEMTAFVLIEARGAGRMAFGGSSATVAAFAS
jgi:transposase